MAESRNFLKVIADPDGAEIDVVAVHGLNYTDRNNHAELTWTAPNGKMWLRDFLPTKLPKARILLFGYNAGATFEVSTAGVDEQAEILLNRLRDKRKGGLEKRLIIFICYSLGGIIVKRALVGAKLDESYESIRKLCHGIAFFGTPHRNGYSVTLGEIAGSIARVSLQNTFQEALTADSLFSNSIANDFRHQLGDRYVITFYETRPVQDLGKIIVDKRSATLGLSATREKRVALRKDHENLCKFSSQEYGSDYWQVVSNIEKLAEGILRFAEDRKERPKILKWMSRIPIIDHHSFICSDRLVGTGNWLLEKPEFIRWRESDLSSILWLHGMAGAGKSKLTSLVVDTFRQSREEKNALAYFYCNYKEEDRRDPVSILRAIVRQLSTAKDGSPLPLSILTIYRERVKNGLQPGPLTLDECKDLILELTANFEQTVICIDALDECHKNTREKLLHVLQYIVHSSNLRSSNPPRSPKGKVKIFITSRDDDDIVLKLGNTPNIYIRSGDNTSDICYFVETEVEKCICLKQILDGFVEPELKLRIIETIIDGAHGMFLWARLQILSICKEMTAADIEQALTTLPNDLTETFAEMFTRIESQSPETSTLAKKALSIILCAQQPLSTHELSEALYIQPMETEQKNNNSLNEAIILDICQNLVVLDEKLNVLRFIHLSTQDFLQEKLGTSYGHMRLAEICLTILCWPNHGNTYCKLPGEETSPKYLIQGRETHVLARYSVQNWATHIRLSSDFYDSAVLEEQPLAKLQKDFLRLCPAYKFWCKVQAIEIDTGLETYKPGASESEETFIHPLLVACHFGLIDIFPHLLGSKLDHRKIIWEGNTPLHYAVGEGHEMIVEELLKRIPPSKAGWLRAKRASISRSPSHWVNFRNSKGLTPLYIAASNGEDGIVKQLLRAPGVDVNRKNSYYGFSGMNGGETPLGGAAANGHYKVVMQLLQVAGIDVNFKGGSGQTPMTWAASRGHNEVIEELLQVRGVDVNCKNSDGQTAIFLAASGGHLEAVKQLLQSPAVDVNSKDSDEWTPITWAVVRRNHEVVKQLLQVVGIDVSPKGIEGWTPIIWAARHGDNEMVKQLLKVVGLDVNSKDSAGNTALLLAVKGGHNGVVKQLLKVVGVDVNCKDSDGWTPITWAVMRRNSEVVDRLLQVVGIDINCGDNVGWTPVIWAVRHGDNEVVKQLLGVVGADINWKDKLGTTAIAWAVYGGRTEMLEQLLQVAGVDINCKDNEGMTPLMIAAKSGRSRMLKLLIKVVGVDMGCKDKSGQTALAWAKAKDRYEAIEVLRNARAPE